MNRLLCELDLHFNLIVKLTETSYSGIETITFGEWGRWDLAREELSNYLHLNYLHYYTPAKFREHDQMHGCRVSGIVAPAFCLKQLLVHYCHKLVYKLRQALISEEVHVNDWVVVYLVFLLNIAQEEFFFILLILLK